MELSWGRVCPSVRRPKSSEEPEPTSALSDGPWLRGFFFFFFFPWFPQDPTAAEKTWILWIKDLPIFSFLDWFHTSVFSFPFIQEPEQELKATGRDNTAQISDRAKADTVLWTSVVQILRAVGKRVGKWFAVSPGAGTNHHLYMVTFLWFQIQEQTNTGDPKMAWEEMQLLCWAGTGGSSEGLRKKCRVLNSRERKKFKIIYTVRGNKYFKCGPKL